MRIELPEPSAEEREHSARLAQLLSEEMASEGPMPYARFMERCLYAPGLGYYSAGKPKFGAAGDFITAPELGSLFAQCVVQALAPTLRALGNADFLELGGGSGAFAEAALLALAELGTVPERYLILEPSADLRERQRLRLEAALPPALMAHVDWLDRPSEQPWKGVLFANEVIDALPTTRFTLRDGEVMEQHVHMGEDGRFGCQDRPADMLVSAAVRHLERDLERPFADGYRSEVLPQLPFWMQAVAGTLEAGAMLFVDYGHPRQEYYREDREDGTLRAFYRHRVHGDTLAWPGLQDITASVDFTALAEAGNSAGFAVASYLPQAQFLIAAGLQQAFETGYANAPDEAARYALAQQVKHLTLPGEMGEHFQAMLFARGIEPHALHADVLAADQGGRL
ncbi:SAM-dependent methyltransferase [Oleiagrimonas sp. C23AA]|uniref:class I SAM-dependent methyltransferase n=1 Tax=Oleiagrimonas sp. C23AA TaxID=2719047 RepID=UPI00142048D1|nr:SAM-dependent methyltransferase [Oleiagrimonas sp. C23AA]NII11391.1 class I SAM-dependent methyltransferase [Oleiagrimonas sp. C23AA]